MSLTNNLPHGSTNPLFEIIGIRRNRSTGGKETFNRLNGKFTFTNGSAQVVTTQDQTGILEIGDIIIPKGSGKSYYISSVDSATQMTLKRAFGEATMSSVFADTDLRRFAMPFTKKTEWDEEEFGEFGGPLVLIDPNGRPYDRRVGVFIIVTFEWEKLNPYQVDKILTLYNNLNMTIKVKPHADYPLKMTMYPITTPDRINTKGKLIGQDVVLVMKSVDFFTQLPKFVKVKTRNPIRQLVR